MQPRGRAAAKGSAALIQRAELAAVGVRLLEMERDHLLVLADERTGLGLQPVGEALVQLGARLLQERAVGRVADQHVVEAVDRLVDPVGALRLDHVLAT